MEKLSSLVLDRYDDVDGSIMETIPGEGTPLEVLVKNASLFTREELSRLPDEVFAVVLENGDDVLRKFAMADKGNTAVSVEFFLKTGHKLPVEAQKVAAANLIKGCGWYGIAPHPDLEKIAFGLGALIGGALVVPGAAREASANLKAVRGAGPGIMTPEQIKQRRMQMGV